MASHQTPHYQLNQWEPEDQVLRVDFNQDNLQLDQALHSLSTSLQGEEAQRKEAVQQLETALRQEITQGGGQLNQALQHLKGELNARVGQVEAGWNGRIAQLQAHLEGRDHQIQVHLEGRDHQIQTHLEGRIHHVETTGAGNLHHTHAALDGKINHVHGTLNHEIHQNRGQLGHLAQQIQQLQHYTNAQLAGKGNCSLVHGTYQGTGVYGSSQRNRLVFPKAPFFVFIGGPTSPYDLSLVFQCRGVMKFSQYWTSITVKWNNNILEWYSTSDQYFQLNQKNITYSYIALI